MALAAEAAAAVAALTPSLTGLQFTTKTATPTCALH